MGETVVVMEGNVVGDAVVVTSERNDGVVPLVGGLNDGGLPNSLRISVGFTATSSSPPLDPLSKPPKHKRTKIN